MNLKQVLTFGDAGEIIVLKKINKWGLASVVFFSAAFLVPWRYPLCVVYPLLHGLALACSIVAARHGSKYWFVVSALSLFTTGQGILALLVEC